MLYGWIVFGVAALIGVKAIDIIGKIKLFSRVEKSTADRSATIEDVTQELLERNAALLERASKKGAA